MYLLTLFFLSSPWVLLFYLSAIISVLLLMVVLTVYVYGTDQFHFHHWTVFVMLSLILCHQNEFVAICHAFSMGVFTDGIARYGYDPVFKSLNLQKRFTKL